MLIPDNAYGPNKALAEGELAAWGITHRLYDAMDPPIWLPRSARAHRLVWLEAAGLGHHGISRPARAGACVPRARRHDARWTTPGAPAWPSSRLTWAATVPGGLGVDISVHALTKYPSGGGDVLMGSVITRDEALHLKLKLSHMRLGVGRGRQ